MPIWRRRSPNWQALTGWPGCPPGNSHAEVLRSAGAVTGEQARVPLDGPGEFPQVG
jgi:hypothetical protein